MEMIPETLKDQFWLYYFARTKYFLLLYDKTGKPVYAAHRFNHPYKDTLEFLMSGPVQDFFELPLTRDLNSLFIQRAEKETVSFAVGTETPLIEDYHRMHFQFYKSRNIIEPRGLAPFICITVPLLSLELVKINADCFAGIISLTPAYTDIRRLEFSGAAVFFDDQLGILGLNSLFARMTGETDPRSLIGRSVNEFLTFSHSPLEHPELDETLRLGSDLDWEASSGEWPFENHPEEGRDRFEDGSLVLSGPKEGETRYLLLKRIFPLDHRHVRLTLNYRSNTMPGIMLRCMERGTHFSPDIVGYNFSPGLTSETVFKKAGERMRLFRETRSLPGPDRTLEIEKKWELFTLSINGNRLVEWMETAPFLIPSQDRCYLYIRSGTALRLNRIRLASADWGKESAPSARKPLRAWPAQGRGPKGAVYHASVHSGVLGIRNYTVLTFEDLSDLHNRIRSLTEERDRLAALVDPEQTLIGESAGLRNLREQIGRVAKTDLTVLFEGETGTGKGMAAQLLHRLSPRHDAPFIKIDCSSIPSELVESELFGHEKGAFTGAVNRRSGKFEQAEGGTVFLDEVENLPAAAQAKLLAVLEDRAVTSLGGTRQVRLNVRVIAASNRLLRDMIAEGRFRPDLFHRLNQVRLELPSLRERREDIPLLAAHFIDEANRIYHKTVRGLSDEAVRTVYNAPWPGNVRELRNTMFRGHLFCKGDLIGADDLDSGPREPGRPQTKVGRKRRWGGNGKGCTLTEAEIRAAMRESKGVASSAAQKLGVSRITLYKLIKRLGASADQFRT